MERTHAVAIRWVCSVTALAGLVLVPACAPKASHRQTGTMAKTGKVSVSAVVLRSRVNDLTDRFAGEIEQSADRIRLATADDAIRLGTLQLKVNAIPAVYTAGFHADPLGSAMDLWAFAYQFRQFFDQGDGRSMF